MNDTPLVSIPQSTPGNPNVAPIVVHLPGSKSPVWHWIASALIASSSLFASGYLAYQRHIEDFQTRLIIVETQQRLDKMSQESRLDRIEVKIDMLVDRLIGAPK